MNENTPTKIRPIKDVAEEVTAQIIESYHPHEFGEFLDRCRKIMVSHCTEMINKYSQDSLTLKKSIEMINGDEETT